MKKKIVLILAAVLCLSMLLSSCSLFGKDELNFNSVVNADWEAKDDKVSVLSTNGVPISVMGTYAGISYPFIETEKYETVDGNDIITRYIYDIEDGKLLLTLTEGEEEHPMADGENFIRTTVVEHEIAYLDDDHFAVLTVEYDEIDLQGAMRYYEDNGNMFDYYGMGNFYFDAQPGVCLWEDIMERFDVDINMNHRIDVYDKASATPVKSLSWNEISEWTREEYEDECFENNFYDNIADEYWKEDVNQIHIGDNLIIKGTKLYTVDDNGKETFVKDFGISPLPENLYAETEEYYIFKNNNNYDAYTFYNKEFEEMFVYVAPEYESSYGDAYVLNNGNLLVQYIMATEADASKYDFRVNEGYGVEKRYNLATYLVDPKTGEEKEIDFEYLILDIEIAYRPDADDMYFAEDVENVVYAVEIGEEKLIRNDVKAEDWLNVTNEGKIKGSLKFDETLLRIPEPIANGYFYSLNVNDEYVIFNSEGEVVSKYKDNDNLLVTNDFIVLRDCYYNSDGNRVTKDVALYDFAGNKLYDFAEKDAEMVSGYYGFFIAEYKENGETKRDVVFNGEIVDTFKLADGEYNDAYTECYIRRVNVGYDENSDSIYEYRLYNAAGELMLTSENDIVVYTYSDNGVVVGTYVENESTGFNEFKVLYFEMIEK